ncbi:MobF family relaxase [Streptomyces sp. NPDC001584]|uniref:MobF family relaxase n=1 Tax=Streptomyces sp. NPDC001584 TaxID=3154521 RepID=UPI00331B6B45
MMTVHKLSAGDGYAYYISETVSADQQREAGQELGDYYTASGNPPGLWMGSGIEALGVSGTVTEKQMKALYGEGLHPDADRIIEEHIAAGDTVKQALRAAKLGRKYMTFVQKDTPFGRKLHEELETFDRLHQRDPSAQERAEMRGKVGAVQFRTEHGRSPASKEELGRFIKEQEGGKQRNAVAGYDLVFSAPKSVSVLWGLGDETVRKAVEQAHVQAMTETLAWLEQKAAMTRTGVNGIAQEDIAGGLIATRFRHYSNRLGEAMLHDHVVVSNKVQGLDGKWRALDGQLLFMQGVAASELYNQRVVEGVCELLDLRTEAREVTPGKRPVMEIAGVGTDLIEAHSGRSKSIKERTVELVEEYRDRHGYEPSSKALLAITQQATLDTRPDKESAKPLAELRTEWRQQAITTFGADRIDGLLTAAREAAASTRPGPDSVLQLDIDKAAQEVLETVSDHRSVWGRRQVLAEARRWVVQATTGAVAGGDLADLITSRVLDTQTINITPPDLNPAFGPLTRDDGTSIYRRRESELYTSAAVLAAEDRIVAAARSRVIPAVSTEVYEQVEAAYQEANPNRRLDAGQRALARTFATSDRLVAAGIGPAGAGKTTAMRVAADAVRASGGRVIGLGPSARAAAELSAGLDAPAFVLHEWLGARERAAAGQPIRPEFEVNTGDLIIVDEAGMAGSKRLSSIVTEAEKAGALVRLIGDPFQLSAVESGGALRLLANTVDVVELESVHRFRAEGEAAASLILRNGDPQDAWTWYLNNQRVVAGTREQMVHAIFADWQSDMNAGRTALMMADDNASVGELNQLAQAYRLGAGHLDLTHTTELREGVQAHRGDLIVTRKNARTNVLRSGKDFVKNGDQWMLLEVRDNGDVEVRHTDHGGRTILPADYVAKHVDLGYASTGHRGQGATVDTGSGLVTRRTARESAYVQTTRGRQGNRLYVVLDEGMTMHDVLDTIARNSQASVSATEAIRTEQDRAWSISQLAAEYTDVHGRALSLRYQGMARHTLGYSAEAIITEDAWPAVERALRDAERAGFSPERILSAAYHERDFADAEDNAAVLSWRIDNHMAEARETLRRLEESGASRPLKDLTQTQLEGLADTAKDRRSQALEDLHKSEARVAGQPRPVIADGLPVPAWPNREHGDLTRSQLSQAIAQARRDGRMAGRDNDPTGQPDAALRLCELKTEQRLRSHMNWLDRSREEWQREPGVGRAHTAGMDAESVATEMRDNFQAREEARGRLERAVVVDQRVQAEMRLRRILPDGPAPTPDHTGPLPEWLTPRELDRDQYTPPAWIEHLDARRQIIDTRLAQTGEALAVDPPSWTSILGPVPAPGSELRTQWERTAALADAWRTQHQLRDTDQGIGGAPVGERDAAAWQSLHDQVAEVGRRARATEAAVRRGEAIAETRSAPDTTALQGLAPAPSPIAVAEENTEQTDIVVAEGEGLSATPEPDQAVQPEPEIARANREDAAAVEDEAAVPVGVLAEEQLPEAAVEPEQQAAEEALPGPGTDGTLFDLFRDSQGVLIWEPLDQEETSAVQDEAAVPVEALAEDQLPEAVAEPAREELEETLAERGTEDVLSEPAATEGPAAEAPSAPSADPLAELSAPELADPEEVAPLGLDAEPQQDLDRDSHEMTPAAEQSEATENDIDISLPLVDPPAEDVEIQTAPPGEDGREPEAAAEAVAWDERAYGRHTDTELADALAYSVEAANAAQEHVAAQEARAAELLASIAPGGAVERSVDERAERVQAIQDMRVTPARLADLNSQADEQRAQIQGIEERLEEKTRLGRPAVRGDDRQQLETELEQRRTAVADTRREIEDTQRRQESNVRLAGHPADHDRVLADWERSGGTRDEVLARALAGRQRRADGALAEAGAARGRVTELDGAAAQIRQELNTRDAQPYVQRVAEEAQRIQAQQAAQIEQQQQQAPQMPGPDQSEGRSGPKL